MTNIHLIVNKKQPRQDWVSFVAVFAVLYFTKAIDIFSFICVFFPFNQVLLIMNINKFTRVKPRYNLRILMVTVVSYSHPQK